MMSREVTFGRLRSSHLVGPSYKSADNEQRMVVRQLCETRATEALTRVIALSIRVNVRARYRTVT